MKNFTSFLFTLRSVNHLRSFKILMVFMSVLTLQSCAKIYYSPDAYSVGRKEKTIAIIPPTVSIKPTKNANLTALKEEEKKESINFQKEMYAWLLKRKKQRKIKPKIQDIELTNAALVKLNYPEKSLSSDELCKVLGVDAVITSSFNLSKPLSEAAAIALGYFMWGWRWGPEVYASMSIYDAKEDKMIWNYDHKYKGGLGSTPTRLVDRLMRHASSKMPYEKKNTKQK